MPSNLTPTERTLRARAGAFALHALRDPRETTEAARTAARTALDRRLAERFNIDVNAPDAARRIEAARRSHFSALAMRAARARRERRSVAERAAISADLRDALDDLSGGEGDE